MPSRPDPVWPVRSDTAAVRGASSVEETLTDLPVLVLDAQATAARPGRGALLEVGWACSTARGAGEGPALEVTAPIVARPAAAVLPPAVARLTGLGATEWARGVPPPRVWEDVVGAARGLARPPDPAPAVIHFARFEEPFLRALHERHGTGPFPLDLICTHAIAARLLPELPRRTLRALAGYFGAGVAPLRRSSDHVRATAFVWHHLVALLREREGVEHLRDLREWLARAARRAPRRFPLPRERRLELPDRPGVYRLRRRGGAVLYVGKAASLRRRVSGHFHARAGQGERALEMLTQVREVSWSETATALEAALLEADEIKRLAPPYNVALAAEGRPVLFATRDLRGLKAGADLEHVVGPLVLAAPIEGLQALRDALALRDPAAASPFLRSRSVGVDPRYAPGPECFAEGLAGFVRDHGLLPSPRDFLRLGARLWAARAAATAGRPEPEDPAKEGPPPPRRPAWTGDRVQEALEETVLRAAHGVRRGRWLLWLSECSLAWAEREGGERRLLVLLGGAVAERADLPPGAAVPAPPGCAHAPADRRAVFDLATFDRLRVLTTELRGLAAGAASVDLRVGRHARLSRDRLRAVLRWV
jgi:DNA polymerase-3 subunit epsilon